MYSRIGSTLLALLATLLLRGTAFAQSTPASTQQGPPSVLFLVGIVGVFVVIAVGFVVFARSQGCDSSKEADWAQSQQQQSQQQQS